MVTQVRAPSTRLISPASSAPVWSAWATEADKWCSIQAEVCDVTKGLLQCHIARTPHYAKYCTNFAEIEMSLLLLFQLNKDLFV